MGSTILLSMRCDLLSRSIMSRRSSRASNAKVADVAPNVLTGLTSFVQGREPEIRKMMECDQTSESGLVTKLLEVMGVNTLSVEVGHHHVHHRVIGGSIWYNTGTGI